MTYLKKERNSDTMKRLITILFLLSLVSYCIAQESIRKYHPKSHNSQVVVLMSKTKHDHIALLAYSKDKIGKSYLEINNSTILEYKINRVKKFKTLPRKGFLRLIQIKGKDTLQLAAVDLKDPRWTPQGKFHQIASNLHHHNKHWYRSEYPIHTHLVADEGKSNIDKQTVVLASEKKNFNKVSKEINNKSEQNLVKINIAEYEALKFNIQSLQDSLESLSLQLNEVHKEKSSLEKELTHKEQKLQHTISNLEAEIGIKKPKYGITLMSNIQYGKLEGPTLTSDNTKRMSIGKGSLLVGVPLKISEIDYLYGLVGGGTWILNPDEKFSIHPSVDIGIGFQHRKLYLSATYANALKTQLNSVAFQVGYKYGRVGVGVGLGLMLGKANNYFTQKVDNLSSSVSLLVDLSK